MLRSRVWRCGETIDAQETIGWSCILVSKVAGTGGGGMRIHADAVRL